MAEIHADAKRLYRDGGVEAVRLRFKCIPREDLRRGWEWLSAMLASTDGPRLPITRDAFI